MTSEKTSSFFTSEQQPLLRPAPTQQIPQTIQVVVPNGWTSSTGAIPTVMLLDAKEIKDAKNRRMLWSILVGLMLGWLILHTCHFNMREQRPHEDDGRSSADYNYPSNPDIIPSNEFEEPIYCKPHELQYPSYPSNGAMTLPTNISNLDLLLTGIGAGQIFFLAAPSNTTELTADIHFHLSDPSIPVSIENGWTADGKYKIHVITPLKSKDEDSKHTKCVGVAIRVFVPKGSLKDVEGLSVNADVARILVDLSDDDAIKKELRISSKVGSVHLRHFKAAGAVIVKTTVGSIDVQNVIADDLSLSTSTGSIKVNTVTTSNSLTTESETGSISLESVTGSFQTLSMKSEVGSISASDVKLDQSVKTQITCMSNMGSVALNLIDFLGKFHVEGRFGAVKVKGSDIDFTKSSRNMVEGVRRCSDCDVSPQHDLNVVVQMGSVHINLI
ncbi:hypothetical protein HDU67_005449 [Dinochytrium kinnereticum]|nr:hypothetical protein HDU67_005449 [Dinochytrium kinnereticum]